MYLVFSISIIELISREVLGSRYAIGVFMFLFSLSGYASVIKYGDVIERYTKSIELILGLYPEYNPLPIIDKPSVSGTYRGIFALTCGVWIVYCINVLFNLEEIIKLIMP